MEVGLRTTFMTEFLLPPNLFRASLFIFIRRLSFLRDLVRFWRPVLDLEVRPDTLARRLLRNLLNLERGIGRMFTIKLYFLTILDVRVSSVF